MATTESPIASPAPGWGKRFPRDEKVFFILIIAAATLMTLFAIGWVLWGSQNVPDRTGVVDQKEFAAQVNDFASRYSYRGKVWVPPGTDAYMLAFRYGWTPELALQEGEKYTIWISAADVLHGFSIVGQNINLQIAPKHSFGMELTPEGVGRHRIICNEFCGLGHQDMTAFLNVVTASEMAAAQQAIGSETSATSGGGGSAPSGAIEISADPDNALAFDVTELSAEAGSVTISMENPSALQHNVAIKGNGVDVEGEVVGTGGTSTVAADLQPGTYTFYCSVPGHEDGGMTGELIVQ